MSLNLAQLITLYRETADDNATPPFMSDTLATSYFNEAQVEAARRARLFKDTTTTAICISTATAGQQSITLDPRVIFVRRVKIDSKDLPLSRAHQRDLDAMLPNWDSIDYQDVCRYIPDRDTGALWFDSKFQGTDTIRMAVIREPLADMSLDVVTTTGTVTNTTTGTPPEVRPRYQRALVDWVVHRALNSRDFEEKYDPVGAKKHLDMFEAEFGKKSSAIDETWIERENQYDENDGVF
jgi:hypothetical protein